MPVASLRAVKNAASKRKPAANAPRALEMRVKQLERLLAARTVELEESAARRQADRVAYEQLEKSVRSKDAFLAVLSHQLRNPLNAIVGWSHLLREGGLDAQSAARGLDTICRNAELEGQLISELVEAWQLISGGIQPDPNPVDLVQLLKAVVDRIRPVAEAKHLQLEMDLAPDAAAIQGDSGRLEHVLASLLSNAVAATRRGGRLRVRLKSENGTAEVAVLREANPSAAGGSPDAESRDRPDSLSEEGGGWGLSYAVARHFVELHGGTIEARRAPSGPALSLRLPLAESGRPD